MSWIAWSKLTQTKKRGGLGFREFQNFNDAFLAKLSWRIINDPNSLLGRTLLGKYCPNGDLLLCQKSNSSSHGWKSVLIGRDLLSKNVGWLVRDGNSIEIWNEPWLNLKYQEGLMGPVPDGDQHVRVSQLLTPESTSWDVDKIRALCPAHEAHIRRIKPSTSGAPDKVF